MLLQDSKQLVHLGKHRLHLRVACIPAFMKIALSAHNITQPTESNYPPVRLGLHIQTWLEAKKPGTHKCQCNHHFDKL
jgi:hypothetical protein